MLMRHVHGRLSVLLCGGGDKMTWVRVATSSRVDYLKVKENVSKIKKKRNIRTYFKLVTWQLCHVTIYCYSCWRWRHRLALFGTT